MTREIQIAEDLSNAVNTFSFDQQAFNKAMNMQHKTLQQSMGRAFLGWLEDIAKKDNKFFDARNEGLKKLADELIGKFKEEHDNIPPSQFLGYI